jgi:hypothetical protein
VLALFRPHEPDRHDQEKNDAGHESKSSKLAKRWLKRTLQRIYAVTVTAMSKLVEFMTEVSVR